jgi:hypothetical protein
MREARKFLGTLMCSQQAVDYGKREDSEITSIMFDRLP